MELWSCPGLWGWWHMGALGPGQPSWSAPAAASFRGVRSGKSFETLTRELGMAGRVIIINGLCYRISGA